VAAAGSSSAGFLLGRPLRLGPSHPWPRRHAPCRVDLVAGPGCALIPSPSGPSSSPGGVAPATTPGAVCARTTRADDGQGTDATYKFHSACQKSQRGRLSTTPQDSGMPIPRHVQGERPGCLMPADVPKPTTARPRSRSKITRTELRLKRGISRVTERAGRPVYLQPTQSGRPRLTVPLKSVSLSCRSPGPPGRAGATASMQTPHSGSRLRTPPMPTHGARAIPPQIPRRRPRPEPPTMMAGCTSAGSGRNRSGASPRCRPAPPYRPTSPDSAGSPPEPGLPPPLLSQEPRCDPDHDISP